MKKFFSRYTALFALAALTVLLSSACKTTDEDVDNERPWNTPKSWESGIPQGMMQGR
jgi:hypothetical protein